MTLTSNQLVGAIVIAALLFLVMVRSGFRGLVIKV